MNIRLTLLLCALFASALISRADDSLTNQWFAGMLNPPEIVPVLPTNFIVVSASPESRSIKKFNMSDGNIWAPERTARQFEFGVETRFSKAQDPMFLVRLSTQVAQYPGKGKFTIEKDLARNVDSLGLKDAKTKKSKWGKYPVLRPDRRAPQRHAGLHRLDWNQFARTAGPSSSIIACLSARDIPQPKEQQIWGRFSKN